MTAATGWPAKMSARQRVQVNHDSKKPLCRAVAAPCVLLILASAGVSPPAAHADNKRLNDAVVSSVYTVQHQAGCSNDVRIDPQLQLAAEWHARDVLNNPDLDGDIGSDGSAPQDRADRSGFHGRASETVAVNPALAISGIETINQWYYQPSDYAIMADCANTLIGVWSENSLARSVVVAVYGKPQ